MNIPSMIIINENLKLEQLQVEDAPRLFELTEKDREYLSEFLPWPEFTKVVEDSRAFIESTLKDRSENSEYGYGIKYKNIVYGHISLMYINDGKDPEIGYWIASEMSGKGLTTTVAKTIENLAFDTLGFEKVIIRVDPKNVASNRIAEKLEFTFLGEFDDEKYGVLNVWEKLNNRRSHE